jgi:hypothetical protein
MAFDDRPGDTGMSSHSSVCKTAFIRALAGSKKPASISMLPAPFVLEIDPASITLQPNAVPEGGVTVRVPPFNGMFLNQQVELHWRGKTKYTLSEHVSEVGRCIDFVLPRKWVLESTSGNWGGLVRVSYTAASFAGPSSVTEVLIADDTPANAPVTAPTAIKGVFDPAAVPEPGLRLVFPERKLVFPMWCSYGREGQRIATVYLPPSSGADLYISKGLLSQTESGGDVWISYVAQNNEGEWVESQFTRLRVIGQGGA